MTDSASKLMTKKMDYQLRWILANKNEYKEDFILAAKEELIKRKRPVNYMIKRLWNRLLDIRFSY